MSTTEDAGFPPEQSLQRCLSKSLSLAMIQTDSLKEALLSMWLVSLALSVGLKLVRKSDILSIAMSHANLSVAAYCASKSAVIGMTRGDAIDYSKDHIRVNAVCPGLIKTAMTSGTKELDDRMGPAANIAPMRRHGLPAEIADSILFLCSTKASFVQGHAMVVDGGYIIN